MLISAVGILNRPLIPDLAGLDDFEGPVFHSAGWDHSVDLRGKRVALVGAGASGFQIGPAIVDTVDRMVVFKRTPQWMAPNRRYHATVSPGEQWAMRHLPGYSRWYRFMLMWQSSDQLLELVRIDPNWRDLPHTANEWSAQRRDLFAAYLERRCRDNPDLLAKVMPDYPPMAKRMLQDNGSWLRCLQQPHVELVRDEIVDIDRSGIATAHARYDLDVIVLATGFRASEVLWPMDIVGRHGVSIADAWDGKPSAYLGTSVPGFPNFFIMSGPGTLLAHGGSFIEITECQMRYIGDALRLLIDGHHRSIEPTPDAGDRYRHDVQAELATLMWGHPSIEHSWFKIVWCSRHTPASEPATIRSMPPAQPMSVHHTRLGKPRWSAGSSGEGPVPETAPFIAGDRVERAVGGGAGCTGSVRSGPRHVPALLGFDSRATCGQRACCWTWRPLRAGAGEPWQADREVEERWPCHLMRGTDPTRRSWALPSRRLRSPAAPRW